MHTIWVTLTLLLISDLISRSVWVCSISPLLPMNFLKCVLFFCSGIQFNLLLSPYPCFISLLYLDLYVLGDDALIS